MKRDIGKSVRILVKPYKNSVKFNANLMPTNRLDDTDSIPVKHSKSPLKVARFGHANGRVERVGRHSCWSVARERGEKMNEKRKKTRNDRRWKDVFLYFDVFFVAQLSSVGARWVSGCGWVAVPCYPVRRRRGHAPRCCCYSCWRREVTAKRWPR